VGHPVANDPLYTEDEHHAATKETGFVTSLSAPESKVGGGGGAGAESETSSANFVPSKRPRVDAVQTPPPFECDAELNLEKRCK
jgi:hypothetical protein